MGFFMFWLAVGAAIEAIWSPRLDWIEKESLLLLYYNKKYTRAYLVIIKF